MLEKYIEDSKWRNAAEWVIAILVAFIIYMILNNYVFKIANIMGSSMDPTLNHGEKVFVNRLAYTFSEPKAGDIIAFPYKENPSEHYVKRIVGVPGDVITFENDMFWVNDELAGGDDFNYSVGLLGDIEFPYVVPAERYFVLGDNRNSSKDSRNSSVGCISKENMIGKISFRILPFSKMGSVK